MDKQYHVIDLYGNGGFILFGASNKPEELGEDATPIVMLAPGVPLATSEKIAEYLNQSDPEGKISELVTTTIHEQMANDPRFSDMAAYSRTDAEEELFGSDGPTTQ